LDTVQVNDGNQLDLFLKQNVISNNNASSALNWQNTTIQINNLLGYYVTSDYYLDYCSKGCSSCDNSSYCNSCLPTLILENDNQDCLSCPLANCNTCFNETQCEICNSGYTERNGTCVSCQTLFDNCESCEHDYCSNCLSGYYIKNNTCVSNNFAISFPNGIIGQFYHFFSQQCLNVESNGYTDNSRQMFMPCNGPASNNSLFKITHFKDDQYIISPLMNLEFGELLTANCSFSESDQKSHFMISNNNSTNSTSFMISNNNSTNSTSNSSFSCLPLQNFSCQNYQDIYYFNNASCFPEYINESSIWKLQMINDPNAFGDSRNSLLLQSSNLNNLCLSYSDDGLLQPCDSESFDFMFGFKIIDISQVENDFVSNLTGYSDTISLKWIDSSTFNTSNYIFLIYYFTDFDELQGYTCGSDKPNSPVTFNQSTDQYGFAVIEVNLTLNDLITCGCRTYEDDVYIYFVMMATNYDPYDNIVFADSYTIMFQKVAESETAIYAGYTTDSNNTQGEIEENDKSVTYLNVSDNLNVSFSNLYSNKYLNKNQSQMICVTYATSNRFTLNLLNSTVFFVNSDTTLNTTYAVNSNYSNNNTNEIDIYFNLINLPSGYYSLQFNIDFEMMQRILAENNVEPSNFTSTFVSTTSYYIGTIEDIQKQEAINQPLRKEETSEIDVKMILIGILTGLLGLLIFIVSAIFLMKRYRNAQKKKKMIYSTKLKDKISEVNAQKEDRSPDRLISQKTQV